MRRQGIGAAGWLVVAVILAAGAVSFISTIVYGVLGGQGSLTRLEAPGETNIVLPRAGRYVIYLEYPRTVDSQRINRPRGIEKLQAVLLSPEGTPVPLDPAAPDNYAIRRLVGEAYRSFEIPQPGRYTFRTHYPESNGPALHIVFKRNYQQQVVQTFVWGACVLLLTAATAGLALAWFSSRARSQQDVEFRL